MSQKTKWHPFEALGKWHPLDNLARLWHGDNRIKHFFKQTFECPVDVWHDEETVTVQALLPDIIQEELKVSILDEAIRLKATRPEKELNEGGSFVTQEIFRGQIERTINLPSSVDVESSRAEYVNGLLTVTLTKKKLPETGKIEINFK